MDKHQQFLVKTPDNNTEWISMKWNICGWKDG